MEQKNDDLSNTQVILILLCVAALLYIQGLTLFLG